MATYYVDATSGDDGANGTSDSTPWKTIAKVNAATFSAGDSILFKKGETWREQLTVPSSGSTGNPITFGAYGTGALPIIRGDNLITPSTSWASYVPDWTVVFSGSTAGGDWNGGIPLTSRFSIPADTVAVTGTKIRLTLKARSNADSTFNKVNIGIMTSGDVFDGAPTSITFDSGNASSGVVTADTTKLTDEVTYDFDPTKRYGISVYLADDKFHDYVAPNGNWIRYNCYGDEATTLDLPTTGTTTGRTAAVIKIEIQGTVANVWTSAVTTEPKIVYFNGTIGQKKTTIGALASARDWYWAANVLYVYAASDPDTLYTSPGIEIGQRNLGVELSTQHYLTVDSLELMRTNVYGLGTYASTSSRVGITISNCSIHDFYESGIRFYNGSAGTGNTITITGNTIYSGGKSKSALCKAILINEGVTANPVVVTNNTCYSMDTTLDGDGIFIGNGIPTITGNTIYSVRHGISLGVDCGGATISRNKVYSTFDDALFITERVSGSGTHAVSYNLFYSCGDDGIDLYTDSNVYNNTIYNAIDCGIVLKAGTFNIKNNIVFTYNQGIPPDDDQGGMALYVIETTASATVSNNCFGPEGSNFIHWLGTNYSTYDAFETAYGGTTSSIEADPLFISAADFRLQATSPCINAGVDVSLTTDYVGNIVPKGALPDIGAYEWFVPIVSHDMQVLDNMQH